jgi:hypothetical protein
VETQINVAESKLHRISNEKLADTLQSQLDKLRYFQSDQLRLIMNVEAQCLE